jgi:hypothetical protein
MKDIIAWSITILLAVAFLFTKAENLRLDSELSKIKEFSRQQEVDHAKKLSTATNSILIASREYDSVRSERDALSRRLRNATSGSRETAPGGACTARVAELEGMVRDLSDLVAQCDNGWNGCAARKDALIEVIK